MHRIQIFSTCLILLLLLFCNSIFAFDFVVYDNIFVKARSYHNVDTLNTLLQQGLNYLKTNPDDSEMLWRVGRLYMEIALEAKKGKEHREYLETARKYAEKSVKLNDNSADAHFILGSAIGRIAQYAGILRSLFMVGDFDKHILRAIELAPKMYHAYVAMGMRYRDTPWIVGGSNKKAEKYFLDAIEIEPGYINSYYELALLYKKWGKKDKAIVYFEKVISMPLQKDYIVEGKESKENARNALEKMGVKL